MSTNKFKYCSQEFSKKQLELVKHSFERFEDAKVCNKKDFYSKLLDTYISDKDYQHALNIWNEFEMKNMGEYRDLYL